MNVSQALVDDLPALAAWAQRAGVTLANVPALLARDAAGAIVGVLAAAVLDGVAVVIQAAGPDDAQAAMFHALRAAFRPRRLIVFTSNDWLCNELRRAGARHLTPDPCVLIGGLHQW
jgi:hypothetical protein